MRVKQLGFQFNTRSPAKSIVIDSMWVARESSSPMSRHVRHRHRGDVRDVQLAAAGDVAHLPRLHARKRHPVPYRPDAGHPSILAQVFRALALFLLVATWVYYGAWADGLMTPLAIRRFGRSDRSAQEYGGRPGDQPAWLIPSCKLLRAPVSNGVRPQRSAHRMKTDSGRQIA